MTSHSRHNRKPTQALKLAIAAALLASSAAQADETPRTFALTMYSNGVAAAPLMSGDYVAAVQQLNTHVTGLDSDSLSTNRCVAYTVTRQIEAARAACNAAVREAQLAITSLPLSMSYARSEYRGDLALAYSNRAVFEWVSNDAAAAQADLKRAAAVAPKAAFVARNINALQSHTKVAQIAVTPQS